MKRIISLRLFVFPFLIFTSFILTNCDNTTENNTLPSYKMFYLSDSSISFSDVENSSIESLNLQSNPFIEENNIRSFTVYYSDNSPIKYYSISIKDTLSINFSNEVRPFVLVINGQKYSLAEYWPSFMAIVPKTITMYKVGNEFHLDPGDDSGNSKLQAPIIIEIFTKLGIEINYTNITTK